MRAVREERGMSLADAAAGVGVTPRRLAAVEDGRREPDFELMMRLARVLGTTATEFIRRAEPPTPHDTED
jgi:transcriptional regulator with XRE-family HTH domain